DVPGSRVASTLVGAGGNGGRAGVRTQTRCDQISETTSFSSTASKRKQYSVSKARPKKRTPCGVRRLASRGVPWGEAKVSAATHSCFTALRLSRQDTLSVLTGWSCNSPSIVHSAANATFSVAVLKKVTQMVGAATRMFLSGQRVA